jgi:hypothetical protein
VVGIVDAIVVDAVSKGSATLLSRPGVCRAIVRSSTDLPTEHSEAFWKRGDGALVVSSAEIVHDGTAIWYLLERTICPLVVEQRRPVGTLVILDLTGGAARGVERLVCRVIVHSFDSGQSRSKQLSTELTVRSSHLVDVRGDAVGYDVWIESSCLRDTACHAPETMCRARQGKKGHGGPQKGVGDHVATFRAGATARGRSME